MVNVTIKTNIMAVVAVMMMRVITMMIVLLVVNKTRHAVFAKGLQRSMQCVYVNIYVDVCLNVKRCACVFKLICMFTPVAVAEWSKA
jgi:hypothetical protein